MATAVMCTVLLLLKKYFSCIEEDHGDGEIVYKEQLSGLGLKIGYIGYIEFLVIQQMLSKHTQFWKNLKCWIGDVHFGSEF